MKAGYFKSLFKTLAHFIYWFFTDKLMRKSNSVTDYTDKDKECYP